MSSKKDDVLVTVKGDNGADVTLKIKYPTRKIFDRANQESNRTFRSAAEDQEAFLRPNLRELLKDKGIWSDEKEEKERRLEEKLQDKRYQLVTGKDLDGSLKKAVALAWEIKDVQRELNELRADLNDYDSMTAEAQANNARFNMLVVLCTFYAETNNTYFSGLEDYMDRIASDAANKAATTLFAMVYNVDEDAVNQLPENKLLIRHGFLDKKLRKINRDGHLVDNDGRLIDDEGYWVNEKEQRVDKHGRPIDDKGNWLVDEIEFTNDLYEEPKKPVKKEVSKPVEEAVEVEG